MTLTGESLHEHVVRCAWLLRPGQPPLSQVRLTVVDGVLREVGSVPADERHLIEPVVVIPELVNAHTHLEFSKVTAPLEPSQPFPDWIRAVIGYRRQHPEADDIRAAVTSGVQESVRGGVGLIGEICTSDAAASQLQTDMANARRAAVCFREFIGFRAEDVPQRVADLKALMAADPAGPEGPMRTGLSPHAPYSVHPQLFESIVDCARTAACPIAMHLAETRDEIALLQHREGRFRDFLEGLGLWSDSALGEYRSVRPYLEALATCPRALAVHCNYLTDDEIRFLARHPHVAVVYCPRTHAWFGHSEHPAARLRQAGANVILGTDSRASNPDLSIWRELQLATRLSGGALWERLSEVTTASASALGCDAADFQLQPDRPLRMTRLRGECQTQAGLNGYLLTAGCDVVG